MFYFTCNFSSAPTPVSSTICTYVYMIYDKEIKLSFQVLSILYKP